MEDCDRLYLYLKLYDYIDDVNDPSSGSRE
jgi:hypothetical protein